MSSIEELRQQQNAILELAIKEKAVEDSKIEELRISKLREKYDILVNSLVQKVESENNAYMERQLNNLEKDILRENERYDKTFRAQEQFEAMTSNSLQSIIETLRKSWEDEETARAKRLEDRLRGHYSVILEHMESQLGMALQLQDEADKQWIKDVEMRNVQQIKMMNAFEKKCRKLYETRLAEYIERSDEQLNQYSNQLLQVGGSIAQERSRVESQKRRLKMACFQWKMQYSRQMEKKFNTTAEQIESQCMDELYKVLSNNYSGSSSGNNNRDNRDKNSVLPTSKGISTTLQNKFKELSLPLEQQVKALLSMVEHSTPNTTMVSNYEKILEKCESRSIVNKKLERKKYLSYKVKLAKGQKMDTPAAKQEMQELTRELENVNNELTELMRKYEAIYGEGYEADM